MRIRRSYLVLAALILILGWAGESRANPIPCDTLDAVRSGSEVHLTLSSDKFCYDVAPDPAAVITQRDLFLVDLEYTLVETPDFYTLSATDLDVSANSHSYEINQLAQGGYPSVAWTAVDGPDCATLEGTLVGSRADLVLLVDRSCFDTPLPDLEYMAKRNYSAFLLDWTEIEDTDAVRCTTFDDTAQAYSNYYEVGVRAGAETCYAVLNLFPDSNDEDAGVVDAGVQADAGPSDPGDEGGGCASSGRSDGPVLPLLLVGVLLLFWRRRRL